MDDEQIEDQTENINGGDVDMQEIQNINKASNNPADTVLMFIKKFEVDPKVEQPMLSIVHQMLLKKDLTFIQARKLIEQELIESDIENFADYEMVLEMPCSAADHNNFDLMDADRNQALD